VRKIALGAVVAMLLAAFPLASSASADAPSTVHVINNVGAGYNLIDVYLNSDLVIDNLPGNQAAEFSTPTGHYTLSVCQSSSTGIDPFGNCINAGTWQTGYFNPQGASNYTFVAGFNLGQEGIGAISQPPPAPPFTGAPNADSPVTGALFVNDLTPTQNGYARLTINNASLVAPFDVCLDGVKVGGMLNVPGGFPAIGREVEVPAETEAQLAIVPAGSPVCSPSFPINLVAGTNTVVTTVAPFPNPIDPCTVGCFQVLDVGQNIPPSNPDTGAFCDAVVGLGGVQAALKDLIGNVDPTSTTTILNTQPSTGDTAAFIHDTLAELAAGDATVPDDIKPNWQDATAPLRSLIAFFQELAPDYNFSLLPPIVMEQLVEGANGIQLPGVPPNRDIVGATTALANFFLANCAVAPPPPPNGGGGGGAAQPVSASPRFTG
jgi:hypothetical protein